MNTITAKNPERINGVYVIARLRSEGETYFVFNKQYRIPTRSWTLEFPGGVQEMDESSTEAGLRELKEETGYAAKGVLLSSSGRQATMPSRLNDTARHVVAEIDGDAAINSYPKQHLDDAEVITKLIHRIISRYVKWQRGYNF
ncbi:hydrolase, NUDIX family [Oesophagostomum dentatum]|uniref:Hydrolase, NUDIX family n=1 Tax=Oesophagostomum dentatum TaxID=61180 RepID=A0A0B1RY91_OESDE|nr:hydrolase, NUDIX family [Oesophagostomum dentatum]